MIEKTEQNKEILKMATIAMAGLTGGTFTAGFSLITLDYISSNVFIKGIGIGFAAASALTAAGLTAYGFGFFDKRTPVEERTPLNDVSSYSLNEGV